MTVEIQGITGAPDCDNCDHAEINKTHLVEFSEGVACIYIKRVEGVEPGYEIQITIEDDGDIFDPDGDFCQPGWDWYVRVDLRYHISLPPATGCLGVDQRPLVPSYRIPIVSWRQCFSGPIDCQNLNISLPFLSDDADEGSCDGSMATCIVRA